MLIYDGDCGICNQSADWARAHLPAGTEIVSWQSIPDLGALGLAVADVETAAYWVDERGRTFRGHRSIGKALLAAGGVWKPVGALILVPPFSWLAALGYLVIAKNRHRLPGGTPACKLP